MKQRTKFKETEIGEIPEDWAVLRMMDVGKVITGKTPPTKIKEYFGSDFPFIKIPDMGESVYIDKSETMLSRKGAEYMGNLKLPKDSVMVSCLATIGKVGITKKDSFTNQQINSLICNKNKIVPLWVYYFLKNNVAYLESLGGGGSVYTNISKGKFENALIFVPELKEQEYIVRTLFDLDSKIELNQQMNKTLEAIGQAVFKHWFVNFEFPNEKGKPYKKSGGEMIDSELGKIPKWWIAKKAINFFKLEYGWHLPEWDRKEGKIPVFGSGGLSGYHNESFVKGAGIIIGRAGKIGPDSVYYSHKEFCPLETTFYVSTDNNLLIRYLYFFIKTMSMINTGSSVPNLSRDSIHNCQIIIPKLDMIKRFDILVEKLFDMEYINKEEIKNLSQIRDSLLPKLMSGKIRVPIEVRT